MDKKNRIALFIIVGMSVAARVLAAIYFGNQVDNLPGTHDQISYHTLALRVLDGYGLTFGETWWPITAANSPTAHWSFLYTFFLYTVYAIFGPNPLVARVLQAVLVGVLQPLLAYLIGKRLFNPVIGLVSALLTAVYIYFIYYGATLMTEPFYITSILVTIYLTIKLGDTIAQNAKRIDWPAVLGVGLALGWTLGITVLLRQIFLMFVPFIFLWLWWTQRKNRFTAAFGATVAAGIVLVMMILPFTLFNYGRFNRLVLLNTNAGYAFYLANHPIYGTHFEPILPAEMGRYQDLIPRELYHLDEAALDQELLKRGLQFVVDDPLRYIQLSISRIPALFMFWPAAESSPISNISRVGSFGIFLPFMLYGLALTLFSKTRPVELTSPVLLPVLFAAIYAAIHILSWALVRYRLPIDAVLLVFAALALTDLYGRLRSWQAQAKPPKQAAKHV